MELVVTLMLGGVTGWLASILVRTQVPVGLLASVAVGAVGSFLGVALVGALGMQTQSAQGWTVVVVVAILTAAWLVGMLRAALGLFSRFGGWS